jgi:PST family polysaccharide transporter
MAKAFVWAGTGMGATQLFTWVVTFTVARILNPADYGLIGMANIYVGLVIEASEFGVGMTVINLRELTEEQTGQLNAVSVLMGAAAVLLSCLVAYPLGKFFHSDRLPALLIAMSMIFVITAFKTVPNALLQREMRFKEIAKIEIASYLTYGVVTLVAAFLGFGYWCLALGLVAMTTVSTALTMRRRYHRFFRPHMSSLRYPIKFSGQILGSAMAWYAYSNSDFLAAGRMLGQSALGIYTLAWTMASAPVDKITNLMVRVLPSFFSAAHMEKETLRTYLLALVEAVSLFVLPLTLGLALVADQFVSLVLGTKWMPIVTPLRILLCYATVRALTNILGPLLNAKRQAHFIMLVNISAAIYFPIGFFLAARWGTTGIATAWVILYPFLATPLFRRSFREIEMRPRDFLRALWPALSASILMTAAVLSFRHFAPPEWPLIARLALEIAVGGIVYLTTMFTVHARNVRDLYQIVRPSLHS